MEDLVYYNELYDLYKELLTKKQRQYFEDYYFDNLSFAEMAENYGVSRNAVFRQLHIVVNKLKEYEKKMLLHEKKKKIISLVEDESIRKKIENIF